MQTVNKVRGNIECKKTFDKMEVKGFMLVKLYRNNLHST